MFTSSTFSTISILNTLFINFKASYSPVFLFTSKYIGVSTIERVDHIIAKTTKGILIDVKYASPCMKAPYDEANTNFLPNPEILANIVASINTIVTFATLFIMSP